MKSLLYFALVALTLTGCVSTAPPTLSESHPANPRAPQSPVPPPTPMLVAGAQGLVLPVSTNQMEMMEHGQHQPMQMPMTNSAPSSATEHRHEHHQEDGK